MAIHDTETTHAHNLTEPVYKQVMDLSKAAERYIGTERFANTSAALSNIVSEQAIGPHVTINNILLPETRGSLDAEDYVDLKSGAKRNMGTVPPQNMNRTVNPLLSLYDVIQPYTGDMADPYLDDPYLDKVLHNIKVGNRLPEHQIDAMEKVKLLNGTAMYGGNPIDRRCGTTGFLEFIEYLMNSFKRLSELGTITGTAPNGKPIIINVKPAKYNMAKAVRCDNPIITEASAIEFD